MLCGQSSVIKNGIPEPGLAILPVILPGLRFWVRWNADLQTLRGSIAPGSQVRSEHPNLIKLSRCNQHSFRTLLPLASYLLFPSISPPALSQPALTPSLSVLRPMPSVVTSVGIGSGLTLLPGRSRQAGRGRLAPNTFIVIIAWGGCQNRGVRSQSRDQGGRQHPHKQEGGAGRCGGSWGGREHHDGEG